MELRLCQYPQQLLVRRVRSLAQMQLCVSHCESSQSGRFHQCSAPIVGTAIVVLTALEEIQQLPSFVFCRPNRNRRFPATGDFACYGETPFEAGMGQ